MEFPGLGTLINVITIIGGASIGVLLGSKVSEKLRNLTTDILGLVTLLAAASALTPLWSAEYVDALPKGWALLVILGSLLIGALIGSALHLEEKLEVLGEDLRKRFRASKESPFIEGFVSSSLLFAIGPLAILGSISDGMGTGIDQLVLKSILDFFAAMAFATSLGWGVAASAIPVGIYQGSWTLVGVGLGSILSGYQIAAMTVCGGLMLLCIALRLLKIKEVAVANLLPALAIAPLFALLIHQFN
ncbi:MAG: DUF554 domain-containing protein [Candidatus Nanopelagicaceae bacterium]|nr:DUF554 domain-containing protein [Candidatus Nanopelagicaceae bacterium]